MANTVENAPWVKLRLEELVRILDVHKEEGEVRRGQFQEKLRGLKERQEALQQRRVARLRTEGIVIDLELVKQRAKNPELMKWYDEDLEEGKKIIMKAKIKAMFQRQETNENDEEGQYEYESEAEWDPDDSRCTSARPRTQSRGLSRGPHSREGTKLDLIKENEVYGAVPAENKKKKPGKNPKIDENIKKQFKRYTNVISTSRYLTACITNKKGKLRSPDKVRRQNSADRSLSIESGKDQELKLQDAISITTPTQTPRPEKARGSLVRERSLQSTKSSLGSASCLSRSSLTAEAMVRTGSRK